MSNNSASADTSILPYYVATYKGRSVAVKRDANYQTTIKLVQKSIPKLRTSDIQDIFISTTLSDYDGALVQISEEIWPDVVIHVKTVEITLEGDDASDPADVRTGNVTWTARDKSMAATAATMNQTVQRSQTAAASAQDSAGPASTPADTLDSLSITVRAPSHMLLEFNDLRPSTKIEDVKSLIEDRYGMPAALQRLDLLGEPLDDSMTLAQSDITVLSIVDLILNARQYMIHLRPGYDQYNRHSSYQNVQIQLSLNRAWELAALRHPAENISKDYVQSVSWTVDVAQTGELTEHESGTGLSYLFWDGVARPTEPTTLVSHPASSQPAGPSSTSRSQLTPLLDPRNSTAVPFGEVHSYIQNLFLSLLNYSNSSHIPQFAFQLKKKPHEYLALRFIPQAECETIAPLSISPPTNYIARIFVLYKGLTATAAQSWDSFRPNHAQGAAIWKDIAGITKAGWGVAGGCLNVVEISWMEVP